MQITMEVFLKGSCCSKCNHIMNGVEYGMLIDGKQFCKNCGKSKLDDIDDDITINMKKKPDIKTPEPLIGRKILSVNNYDAIHKLYTKYRKEGMDVNAIITIGEFYHIVKISINGITDLCLGYVQEIELMDSTDGSFCFSNDDYEGDN